ncbi:MAG: phenylalanine--tRNA ligase subunit beta [Armatimonadetes bacterium]|nr:phenylalanine--tRNA ligase subunit beta [Armatimonadota bacterium]
MLVPIEWLKEYVSIKVPVPALAERLTLAGLEVEAIHAGEDGPILDLYVTPNRGDCLSIVGVAREVAVLTGSELRLSAVTPPSLGSDAPTLRVDLDEPRLCPRYVARLIRGVTPGPSPEWMQRRLIAAGLRPISNLVDVTNYVMLELGHPLHVFDAQLLREGRIVVRRARPDEKILTIDGTEVDLTPETLVIADAERPVAIAGVMGGAETAVSEATRDVLLEAAAFDPVAIRRTAKLTGILTESSRRFERVVDPNGVERASARAAQLLAKLAGGMVSETVVDCYPHPVPPAAVRFRPDRCRALLGAEISDASQERYLVRLGLAVERLDASEWQVSVPTFRPDLSIEADLIEEVGRLHGYMHLPDTLPQGAAGPGRISELGRLASRARQQLMGDGLHEGASHTLLSGEWLEKTRLTRSPIWLSDTGVPITLRNPISEEFATLRPSLLPGLLQAALYNCRRGTEDVWLFESGWAHALGGEHGAPDDRFLVSGLMLGSRWSETWNPPADTVADFFACKGVLEQLAGVLGLPALTFERASIPAFHPGRAARALACGRPVAVLGELHPEVAAAIDLPRGVYLFELDGQACLELAIEEHRYRPPSRFPAVERALAVVASRGVPAAALEEALRECLGDWARRVRLFDAYSGKGIPEGYISLAYQLEIGAEDRTLTEAEADERLEAVRNVLRERFRATFRG